MQIVVKFSVLISFYFFLIENPGEISEREKERKKTIMKIFLKENVRIFPSQISPNGNFLMNWLMKLIYKNIN